MTTATDSMQDTRSAEQPEHQLDGGPAHDRDLVPFVALEAATLIAGTGNGVAAIALPWLSSFARNRAAGRPRTCDTLWFERFSRRSW